MQRRIFNNFFLILYPILPLILLPVYDYHFLLLLRAHRYPASATGIFLAVAAYVLYFLVFAWFIVRFFMKKEKYNFFSAVIGLLESVVFLVFLFDTPLLPKISRQFSVLFFNNVTLSSYAVFTVFSLYAVLLVAQRRN